MREHIDDFRVEEQLGFDRSGTGQHVWLRVRKRNTNTDWLARQLAGLAKVPLRDVGYAGLKDRHAVTTQWFSVDLRGQPSPDWHTLGNEDIEILDVTSHDKKLRRGAHAANRFEIVLRQLTGDDSRLEDRLQHIAVEGVPNYFGEQRFGKQFSNLRAATDFFERDAKRKYRRHQRSLYLSAARSWVFNMYLSERVREGTWREAMTGDVLILKGSKSFFHCAVVDDEIKARIAEGDVVPSGPLWGQGELPTSGQVLKMEQNIGLRYETFCRGLESYGLKQQRRSLVLQPEHLQWEIPAPDTLVLKFALPAGGFATSVIRELAVVV